MGTIHTQSGEQVAHTFGHIDCPACERARAVTLSRILPSSLFAEAAAIWLDARSATASSRARFLRKSTQDSYRHYIESLDLFFGNLRLEQIHVGHLRQYQEARIAGAPPFIRKRRPNKNVVAGPCPAAPKKVNQELSILKMILRRAQCWTQELDEFYEPYREEINDVPRALSPEEQQRWLAVARSRQDWWLVYWYSVLAFETSLSTNELRALRIGDVNLHHGILNVANEGAKNRYRARTIPLVSAEARWVMEQLLARAKDLGAASPLHYIFPFRDKKAPHDPTRPMSVSGIKRWWNEVRTASGLKWFRPYDTRHTAITRWAEGGMNPSDIMALAGHVSQRMMMHYTHISQQAKRRALEKVAATKKGPVSENHTEGHIDCPACHRAGFEVAPFYVSQRRE